ncbi:hypothetical protein EC973_007519 [Apophysomyces ossiformis]|uniref:GATA-type domain-containing protein n=1 Tax=Apophysomyces ossiformis TaxID=679940 RepID=A0A8H7BPL6_9FUNG|nr:hypothetical protein EC973_007519 [Apophysomyces ossiformis]
MFPASRLRSNSEMQVGRELHRSSCITDAFHPFHLPRNLGQECLDPTDGHMHRFHSRHLGCASLKLGTHCFPNVAFYEITESEILEGPFSDKKPRSPTCDESTESSETVQAWSSGHGSPDMPSEKSFSTSPECSHIWSSMIESSNLPGDTMATDETSTSVHGLLGASEKSLMALPPKKRKRRRLLRYDIVFCLPPRNHTGDMDQLMHEYDYYVFPHEAVAETLNDTDPFEVLFSFHLRKSSTRPTNTLSTNPACCSHSPETPDVVEEGLYKTKLEEFAAVCSSRYRLTTHSSSYTPQRRFTDPGRPCLSEQLNSECYIVNVQMAGVSRELYQAIKHAISGFEVSCQNMMELMRFHTERVVCQRAERSFNSEPMCEDQTMRLSLTKAEIQSEQNRDHGDTQPSCEHPSMPRSDPWHSGDEAGWDKESAAFDDDHHSPDADDDAIMASPELSTRSNSQDASASTVSNDVKTPQRGPNSGSSLKKCLYCGSKSTPMWRRGPQGAGTLCNACGVKWKHGKILSDSDAFVAPSSLVKERRRSSKSEKKRKKSTSSTRKDRRGKAQNGMKKSTSVQSVVDQMSHYKLDSENDVGMTELYEDNTLVSNMDSRSTSAVFTVPAAREYGERQGWERYSASSHSPLESFTSSRNSSPSPPMMEPYQRHSVEISMADKLGFTNAAFPITAGVDAVEAAAVLTLLKRS